MKEDLLSLAGSVARAAGELLRARFLDPRTGVATKSSATDMVTDADRAAETTIVEGIRRARPDDAILGEETGERPGTSGMRWVVDPLDGTTNFLFGIPHWAVSIAAEDSDGALCGVVYDALRDELFSAARGGGTALNGSRVAVSSAADLERALVATGFSYRRDERAIAGAMIPAVLPRVRDIRRAGAASLDLAWTACGRFDGYYETPVEWWDVAAGLLLVREAGGVASEIESVGPGVGVVAAGPGIHDELRALVGRALAESRDARARP